MAKNTIFDPTKDGVKADNSGYSSNQIDNMIGESAAAVIDDAASGDDTVFSSAKIYSLLPEDTATGTTIYFNDAIPALPLKSFSAAETGDKMYIYNTNYTPGYLSNNTGDIANITAYNQELTTDFIPCNDTDDYTFDWSIYGSPENLWIGILFYDENKDPIGTRSSNQVGEIATDGTYTRTTPEGAAYVRVSVRAFGRLKNIKIYHDEDIIYDLQPSYTLDIPVSDYPVIKTHEGYNTLWTNTGGLSVTYKKLTTLS